ncbi:MAG: DEAD/DEAH box helicase, partial [Muribaculaceae bacterium]|nr:DEAD/DEAH box helicase [Muribaculaceae bacterium]
ISTQFENGRHVQDPDFEKDGEKLPSYRLNVADISFKLYEKVVLADTMSIVGPRVIKRLRPVEVRFKDYSPYLRNNRKPVKIATEEELWTPYPYGRGERKEIIEEWAKTHRKLLWDNQLWNEFGSFANILTEIHHAPEIFIQAEHTAQVDKIIARKVQDEFKKRRLNILACSTTMEMGVDLGSLELVMMSSVPPMPSNYKQRAGRSGRSLSRLKSVAVTLCGSDSIGLRTLFDPISNIIDSPVSVPTVDLQSPQVVQRHVNAFLIRESRVFDMGEKGGNLSQRVLDYYTDLRIEKEGNHYKAVDTTGHEVIPIDEQTPESSHIMLIDEDLSIPYFHFNRFCLTTPSTGLQKRLETLLQGTFFEGQQKSVIINALAANKQSRNELLKKIDFVVSLDWQKLTERQRDFFKLKFKEPLMTQLIGFWANTHFTPNANMPVNVVNYDVNSAKQKHYTLSTSNPSYDLRNALSQYVPGSSVVIDGRVSVVRGVRYHDFFAKKLVTFKTIYRNAERTVIDNKDEISKRIPWSVNGQEGLKMIQPTEFLPDATETENRIIDSRTFTRVNAQLIGASKWTTAATEPHLYSARSSRQTGNSEILYYNDGIGYGFCHCMECGKIVMENAVANSTNTLEDLPPEMNNKEPRNQGNGPFHYMVGELDKYGKPICCYGSRHPKSIQRNIVLADTILTDYT